MTAPKLPHGHQETESWGFLVFLRQMERRARGKPRIGKNLTLKDEIVTIGQDPSLAFPETDLSAIDGDGRRPMLRNRILGFFGPQGALPLTTTEEVSRWVDRGDRSFVAFTDIFAARFLQLFFRAWSDARAITQFDHESGDRFRTYIAALVGTGTPAFQNRDPLPEINRTALAPLALGRIRSPRRLRQMIGLDLGVGVDVDEHCLSWMLLEQDATNRLGQRGSALGRDIYLGGRVATVNDRILVRLHVRTLAEYRAYLPGGALHKRLLAIVRWYLGQSVEVDVALSLPVAEMPPAVLGQSTELGWIASLAPAPATDPDARVTGARYALMAAA
jgi:type VI secretion system protein ImpH